MNVSWPTIICAKIFRRMSRAFHHRMEEVYSAADLAIARSGAASLAELAAFYALPVILIPFPYAADDHQTRNAEILVRGGRGDLAEGIGTGRRFAGAKDHELDAVIRQRFDECPRTARGSRRKCGRAGGRARWKNIARMTTAPLNSISHKFLTQRAASHSFDRRRRAAG